MEQALPQARSECAGPRAGARARRPAAFALVLETFDVGISGGMGVADDDHISTRAQGARWTRGALFECTRDQRRRPGPFRLDEKRRSVFRRTVTRALHRSTHSTNAGGMSFSDDHDAQNPIVAQQCRDASSAAAMVGYRAHTSATPVADPRLIVGISLNMGEPHLTNLSRRRITVLR
jgi:hypothetical protein